MLRIGVLNQDTLACAQAARRGRRALLLGHILLAYGRLRATLPDWPECCLPAPRLTELRDLRAKWSHVLGVTSPLSPPLYGHASVRNQSPVGDA
jgi:hypothetical protein